MLNECIRAHPTIIVSSLLAYNLNCFPLGSCTAFAALQSVNYASFRGGLGHCLRALLKQLEMFHITSRHIALDGSDADIGNRVMMRKRMYW
jgi:hypothetical protein